MKRATPTGHQKPIRDCQTRYAKTIDNDLRDRFDAFMREASPSNKQFLLGVFVELWSQFDETAGLTLPGAFESTISGHAVAVIPQDELLALRKRVKDMEKIRVFPKAS